MAIAPLTITLGMLIPSWHSIGPVQYLTMTAARFFSNISVSDQCSEYRPKHVMYMVFKTLHNEYVFIFIDSFSCLFEIPTFD